MSGMIINYGNFRVPSEKISALKPGDMFLAGSLFLITATSQNGMYACVCIPDGTVFEFPGRMQVILVDTEITIKQKGQVSPVPING
jgi:hypothetical protein